jgi:serine/threonine-protein kinase
MATMFGRFEVQSELSKSETALIYKVLDLETNQVVALKTQSLEPLGDRADAFVETLLTEGESTRSLAGQNIAVLYGAGEIEGQFCATMEYIQGNSIATMVARREGFSIWDLLDITRQMGAALEKAASLGVVHSSLEPAKIMVQWDGLVKVLGYGISSMSLIAAEMGNGLGRLMPYGSPEQIRGEKMDQRSNLYTLGAILYEMATGQRAFIAGDPASLLHQIENEMPAAPISVNVRLHPAISALIMKALAKDPAERYQTARELVDDLEQAKDNGRKATAETKKTLAAPALNVDAAARAAAAAKFTSAVSTAKQSDALPPSTPKRVPASSGAPAQPSSRMSSPSAPTPSMPAPTAAPANSWKTQGKPVEVPKAAAAAAGQSSSASASMSSGARLLEELDETPISDFQATTPSPVMSAATLEQEEESQSPSIAVDPMMSAAAPAQQSKSFSDLDELPPLKEPVFTSPPTPEPELAAPQAMQPAMAFRSRDKDEKPKVQPKELAEKAIKQIATIPPKLMLFSILGAVAVILVIALGLFLHVHNEDDGSTPTPHPVKPVAKPAPPAPAPAAAAAPAPTPAPPIEDERPDVTVRQIERRPKTPRALAPAPAPVVIPGQALIDSTPQGAIFQLDGKSDPSWVTPFTVTGLKPGKHSVAVNKAGYSEDVRSLDIVSGGKSSLVLHLAPINALVVVNSTPVGAEITLDGKNTGRVTPSQFAVEKGTHSVVLKKQGFLDETATADLGPGQNFQFAPALRALGNAEAIRTVSKIGKLFGKVGDSSTAGMGSVSVRTQPKGAQVAVNQHVLDKQSPLELMMGPGNYVVDVTLTGFKPIHKVITVEKGGKVAIDEVLVRE